MAGRISSIKVGLGDGFKKGAALIEFDCSEQRAQLQAADAEYRGARETHLARLRLQALGAAGELDVTLAAAAADARAQPGPLPPRADGLLPGEGAVRRQGGAPARQDLRKRAGRAAADRRGQHQRRSRRRSSCRRRGSPGCARARGLTIHVKEIGQSFEARVAKLNSRIDGVSQQLEVEARIEKGEGSLLPGMVGGAVFSPRSASSRANSSASLSPEMNESPNPALALLEFERRIQSASSNREVAFRAVNDASQALDFDQAILWRVDVFGRPLIAVASGLADVSADSPFQQWLVRLVQSITPAPFERGARLDHRRAARGGGHRRRGLVPGAPAALPAARPDRRAARRHPVPARHAVHRARARARRLDRALRRLRPVGLAQRPPRLQALAEEPRHLAHAGDRRRAWSRWPG